MRGVFQKTKDLFRSAFGCILIGVALYVLLPVLGILVAFGLRLVINPPYTPLMRMVCHLSMYLLFPPLVPLLLKLIIDPSFSNVSPRPHTFRAFLFKRVKAITLFAFMMSVYFITLNVPPLIAKIVLR